MSNKIDILISAKDDASKSIDNVSGSIDDLSNKGKRAGKSSWWLLWWLLSLKSLWIGAIASLWTVAVNSASDYEQSRVAFDTMLWSAEAGQQMLQQITDFAQNTPFEISGLQDSASKLLAFWIPADQTMASLKSIWDIASGVWKDKLPQLITAYWQVSAKGRLMWDELMQFTEAGVPLVDQLAKSFNKTVPEIQDMISAGQIWFPMVQKAMWDMTWEGGKFNDLMKKQSSTFGGMVSNLKDSISIMLRDFGGKLIPKLKVWVKKISAFFAKNWAGIVKQGAKFINSIIDLVVSMYGMVKNVYTSITGFIWWLFSKTEEESSKSQKTQRLSIQGLLLAMTNGISALKIAWIMIMSFFTDTIVNYLAKWIAFIKKWFLNVKSWIYWLIWKIADKLAEFTPGEMSDKFKRTADSMRKNTKDIDKELKLTQLTIDGIDKTISSDNEAMADKVMAEVGKMSTSVEDFKSTGGDVVKATKEMQFKGLDSINLSIADTTNNQKKLAEEAKRVADEIAKQKDTLKWYYDTMNSWTDDSLKKVKSLKDEYAKLTNQIEKQKKLIDNIWSKWKSSVANRALDIEKEIANIKSTTWWSDKTSQLAKLNEDIASTQIAIRGETTKTDEATRKANATKLEWLKADKEALLNTWLTAVAKEKIYKLEQELATAKKYAGSDLIQQTKIANEQTITDKTIEQTNIKKMQAENELTRLQDLQTAKLQAIKDEALNYVSLVKTKNSIDKIYFDKFWERIQKQIDKTKEAIDYMNKMNQLNGGWSPASTTSGSYTPQTLHDNTQGQKIGNGGVNINVWMNNVSIWSKEDTAGLVDMMVAKFEESVSRSAVLRQAGANN